MRGELTGTAGLVRLALRRDRLLIPAWVGLFAAMAAFSASATVGLYPNEASRVEAANTINSASATVALYGPIYDPTSLGALSITKLTAVYAALLSILMVMLVVRHTRAEEEAGRRRTRLALVALPHRVEPADPGLRRRPLVGSDTPPRR